MSIMVYIASDPGNPITSKIQVAASRANYFAYTPGKLKFNFSAPDVHRLIDVHSAHAMENAAVFMLVLPSTGKPLIEFGYGIGAGAPAVVVAIDTEPLDLEYLNVPVLRTMEEVCGWLSNVQEVPDDDWPW